VTDPGFTPVGNATLVVANVLTCNKHSQIKLTNEPNIVGIRSYQLSASFPPRTVPLYSCASRDTNFQHSPLHYKGDWTETESWGSPTALSM
jgi:hypothetical protein